MRTLSEHIIKEGILDDIETQATKTDCTILEEGIKDWLDAHLDKDYDGYDNKYKLSKDNEIIPESNMRLEFLAGQGEIPSYIKFQNKTQYSIKIYSSFEKLSTLSFLPEECNKLILSYNNIDNNDLLSLTTKKCNLFEMTSSLGSKLSNITSLKNIPDCKVLIVFGAENLTNLKGISYNLENFRTIGCKKLVDISELRKCKNLTEISTPDTQIDDISFLSGSMSHVNVEGCKKLSSIKTDLEYCRHFNCSRTLITTLEGSPKRCDIFDCSNCKKLTSLEGVPISDSIRSKGCPAAGRDGKSFTKQDKYDTQLNSKTSGLPSHMKTPTKKIIALKDAIRRKLSRAW